MATGAMQPRAVTEKMEIIETLTNLLDKKLEPITEKLSKLSKFDTIEHSLDYALEEIKNLGEVKPRMQEIEKSVTKLTHQCNQLKQENRQLKDSILKQELYSRKKNLKLYGFKDIKQENMEDQVLRFFSGIGINLTPKDIDAMHFVGPQVRNRPRSIVIRFLHLKDRSAVWSRKGDMRKKGIVVNEDLPKEIQERRKLIVPTFFRALKLCPELNPKLRVDSMILNGSVYNIDNIKTIPVEGLLPENVFTRTQEGMTAYFSKFSPLSNHYSSQFELDDIVFHSVEQYFMYKKAKEFNDVSTAEKILDTPCPVTAKQLGRHVKGFKGNVWTRVASDHMYTAMYQKFAQNEELKAFLLRTRQTELVEANPTDTTWGVGLSIQNDSIFKQDQWRGKNLAGNILTRVRQTLA